MLSVQDIQHKAFKTKENTSAHLLHHYPKASKIKAGGRKCALIKKHWKSKQELKQCREWRLSFMRLKLMQEMIQLKNMVFQFEALKMQVENNEAQMPSLFKASKNFKAVQKTRPLRRTLISYPGATTRKAPPPNRRSPPWTTFQSMLSPKLAVLINYNASLLCLYLKSDEGL